MYPTRKQALELRIQDLYTRLEELAEFSEVDEAWMVSGFKDLYYSRDELLSVDPEEFYSAREIFKAIHMAENELMDDEDE